MAVYCRWLTGNQLLWSDRIDLDRAFCVDRDRYGVRRGTRRRHDPRDTRAFAIDLAIAANRRNIGMQATPYDRSTVDDDPVRVDHPRDRQGRIPDDKMGCRQSEC